MSNVSRGLGTTLAVGATNIGILTKISNPAMKRDMIDVTVLSSPNFFKQFITGMADGGTIAIEGFFDTADSGQLLVYNKFVSSSLDTYTIAFPSIVGASWTASCYMSDLDLGVDADLSKALGFKMSLRVTGQPNIGTSPTAGLTGLTLTGTGGVLEPTFSGSVYDYSWVFNTSTSITFTPTAGSPQNYTTYIDGVLDGTYTTGSISSAIAFASAPLSHRIDIVVSSAGYTPLVYTIIAVRTS